MKQLITLFAALFCIISTNAQTIEQLFIRDSASLKKELHLMIKEDQKYKRRRDMTKIDTRNTERMIAIINTYGYPSYSRFGANSSYPGNASIILVHAPAKYFDTLQTLIDREKAANRITQDEYAHIDWHLHGSSGVPDFAPGSGIKIKDKRRHKSGKVEIGELQKRDSL